MAKTVHGHLGQCRAQLEGSQQSWKAPRREVWAKALEMPGGWVTGVRIHKEESHWLES